MNTTPAHKASLRPKYRAFISYSHKDKAIATWLHKYIERYKLPKKLVGKSTPIGEVPSKLSPIFRDQDELPASGNLGAELQQALANSMFLVVICSPASAKSTWVNEEIRQFKHMHGSGRVLALIVDGEANASPENEERECFAPALKYEIAENGELSSQPSEPIAADLHKHADGKRLAVLKLISGLTALKLDDLVQRDAARRMRRMVQLSTASFLAAVFAVGLALYANNQRIAANEQRVIAEREAATSKAVSDFLVDSFATASSVEQNPNSVTAKSILESGSSRLASELKGQPLVQARLSATIALAYSNLGLYEQAIDIVDSTAKISGLELTKALLVKAEALLRIGDFDAAMNVSKHAQEVSEQDSSLDYANELPKIHSALALVQALVHYNLGQHDEGLEAFDQAMQKLDMMENPDQVQKLRIYQSRALLLSDMGDMQRAKEDLDKAMKLALQKASKTDVVIGEIYLAQAQVNFLSGDLEPALEKINLALSNLQQVFDNDNPFLANAISMKGQILHAMGDLEQAHAALTEAVSVYTNAYGGRHYLSGIAEVYLALIASEQNNLAESLAHFDEAKLHYDESYGDVHPNHGDLLVNRATVLAAAGEMTRAIQDCNNGMRILEDTLGKDSAFTQQLQAVCDEIQQ